MCRVSEDALCIPAVHPSFASLMHPLRIHPKSMLDSEKREHSSLSKLGRRYTGNLPGSVQEGRQEGLHPVMVEGYLIHVICREQMGGAAPVAVHELLHLHCLGHLLQARLQNKAPLGYAFIPRLSGENLAVRYCAAGSPVRCGQVSLSCMSRCQVMSLCTSVSEVVS